jgi:hypothetical protein
MPTYSVPLFAHKRRNRFRPAGPEFIRIGGALQRQWRLDKKGFYGQFGDKTATLVL